MATAVQPYPRDEEEVLTLPELSQWALIWRRFRRHHLGLAGLALLGALFIVAYLAPVLAPYDPTAIDLNAQFAYPSAQHWLGTDELGRDILSRLMYASRVTLSVALVSTLLTALVGTAVGAIAGYSGGWVEIILMRTADIMLAMPTLLLLLVLSKMLREMEGVKALFGAENVSLAVIVIILVLFGWMRVARLVHGSVLSLREREFVEAARALGASPARIILVHLVPNTFAPIIVASTLGFGERVILESTLSFLGLGITPPHPSLGNMLSEAQGYMFRNPLLAVYPGMVIFLTVLAINFLGDALRDALDPRMKV